MLAPIISTGFEAVLFLGVAAIVVEVRDHWATIRAAWDA